MSRVVANRKIIRTKRYPRCKKRRDATTQATQATRNFGIHGRFLIPDASEPPVEALRRRAACLPLVSSPFALPLCAYPPTATSAFGGGSLRDRASLPDLQRARKATVEGLRARDAVRARAREIEISRIYLQDGALPIPDTFSPRAREQLRGSSLLAHTRSLAREGPPAFSLRAPFPPLLPPARFPPRNYRLQRLRERKPPGRSSLRPALRFPARPSHPASSPPDESRALGARAERADESAVSNGEKP